MIYVYAVERARWERAKAKLAAEGEIRMYTRLDSNGQPHEVEKVNLSLKIAENSASKMVAILDRLGLTPGTRGKIKPAGVVETEAEPEMTFEEKYFADIDAANTKGARQ